MASSRLLSVVSQASSRRPIRYGRRKRLRAQQAMADLDKILGVPADEDGDEDGGGRDGE